MCIWAFLSIMKKLISTWFSLHFGEKTFWRAQGENIWAPPFILLPSHLTKYILKKFFSLFSFQSFSSTYFTSKQTHPEWYGNYIAIMFLTLFGLYMHVKSIQKDYRKTNTKGLYIATMFLSLFGHACPSPGQRVSVS